MQNNSDLKKKSAKRQTAKENGIVVATIALCFIVTLGMCFFFSGESFIGVFSKTETTSFYAVVNGGYQDLTLARSTAELLKQRGGAGYISKRNGIEVILAVYPDKNSAESVLLGLENKGAYINEIKIEKGSLKWCKKDLKSAVDFALKYFPIVFDKLYNLSNDLEAGNLSVNDVKTQIDVLYAQIGEVKSDFYQNTTNNRGDEITEIKLTLVTSLALLNNIEYSSTVLKTAASLRYQAVQLTYCHQALMSKI